MKNYILIVATFVIFQSCISIKSEVSNDYELKMYEHYFISNDILKQFVDDYINLPENKERTVFTLYVDQKMDTLLFTIWRYPKKTIDIQNTFGYFKYQGKVVLICSPFLKFFDIAIDSHDVDFISELYQNELEYYKIHRQELVMWQLQIPYHENTYLIEKNFYNIINTIKPPIPDSIEVDIQYSAD